MGFCIGGTAFEYCEVSILKVSLSKSSGQSNH